MSGNPISIVASVLALAGLAVTVAVAVQVAGLRAELRALAERPAPAAVASEAASADAIEGLEEGLAALQRELAAIAGQLRSGNEQLVALRQRIDRGGEGERGGQGGPPGGPPGGGDGQTGGWRPPEPADVADRLAEQLQLDEEKKQQVAQLYGEQQAQTRALFEQMRAGGDAATQAREQFGQMRERYAAQWREILDEEQVQALEAMIRPGGGRGRGRRGRGGEREPGNVEQDQAPTTATPGSQF